MRHSIYSVGRRIKKLRAQKRMTQRALAAVSGVHHILIANIERNPKRNVYLSTVACLAKALGVKVDDLIKNKASK